jgi:ubiquinone/menaquinone biosynthesis C-methylase UbiE
MRLVEHKRDWEDLARVDPLWAICTDSKKQYGKWDTEEFFKSGEIDIAHLVTVAKRLGHPRDWKLALDFGCGIGRLTRAMSAHVANCIGLDISEEMIARARDVNPGCEFVVNGDTTLPFASDHFDLIYTKYVLQHLPEKEHVRAYITEFVRTLKPGGLLVYQVRTALSPRARLQIGRRVYSTLRSLGVPEGFLYRRLRLNPIRATVVTPAEMAELLKRLHARLLLEEPYRVRSGAGATYYVTK